MCKIAGLLAINDKNRDASLDFMKRLSLYLSEGNDDGLGYAAFDKSGNLFGERWLINDTAFRDLSLVKGLTAKKMDMIYNYFGPAVKRDEIQGMILHARAATCGKSITNTHPFIDNLVNPKSAIIHNGWINNHEELVKKYSTCDSETIVSVYEQHNVPAHFLNIKNAVSDLLGWYTVLALTKDKDGRMVMDAFSDAPRLASMYIPELGTRVYSTRAEDIISTARDLKMGAKEFASIKENTAIRFDVLTGTTIEACILPKRYMVPKSVDHRIIKTFTNGKN